MTKHADYSVLITMEVCGQGNWLTQVSAILSLSFLRIKNLYFKCERSHPDANGRLVLTKNKHRWHMNALSLYFVYKY